MLSTPQLDAQEKKITSPFDHPPAATHVYECLTVTFFLFPFVLT